MTELELECPICMQPLSDGEPAMALLCSHSFHQCCIRTYCQSANVGMTELKCPVCKRTGEDFHALGSTSTPGPTTPERVFADDEDGMASVAPEDAVGPSDTVLEDAQPPHLPVPSYWTADAEEHNGNERAGASQFCFSDNTFLIYRNMIMQKYRKLIFKRALNFRI